MSPFDGFADRIVKLLYQRFPGFDGSIEVMFANKPDFDIDRAKPYAGKLIEDSTIHKAMQETMQDFNVYQPEPATYVRRLEDIDQEFLWKYIYMMWYGIVNDSRGGIKEYERTYKATYMLEGGDEDVEFIEENALITDEEYEEYSVEDMDNAKSQIPYLLKRIHEKSKELHTSIISLLRAYKIAEQLVAEDNRVRAVSNNIAPRHILDATVYKMSNVGEVLEAYAVDANKNSRKFKAALEWFKLSNDSYRRDADQLVYYLEVLGIDIKEEDPKMYNEEFINQLTVITVVSNAEYMLRKGNNLDESVFLQDVYDTLGDMPLEFYSENSKINEMTFDDSIRQSMDIYINTANLSDEDKHVYGYASPEEQQNLVCTTENFLRYYKYWKEDSSICNRLSRYSLSDSFLLSPNLQPMLFDVSCLLPDSYRDFEIVFRDALLTLDGYLVLHSAYKDRTLFCKTNEAVEVLHAILSKRVLIPTVEWEVLVY